MIVVDESRQGRRRRAGTTRWAPLYALLEHDTAQSFTDEFADVAIDASQVIWITTANDERAIPTPS